jgi:hypothetical protein
MRNGLPCTSARVRRRSPSAGAPSTSAATSATAEAFSGVRRVSASLAARGRPRRGPAWPGGGFVTSPGTQVPPQNVHRGGPEARAARHHQVKPTRRALT